jgi:hypothetical protein
MDTTVRIWERINTTRKVDKEMRITKESSIQKQQNDRNQHIPFHNN